jgi:hypothetical protein
LSCILLTRRWMRVKSLKRWKEERGGGLVVWWVDGWGYRVAARWCGDVGNKLTMMPIVCCARLLINGYYLLLLGWWK